MARDPKVTYARSGPLKLAAYADWLAGIWLDAKISTLDDWNPGPSFTPEDRAFIIDRVRTVAKRLKRIP
jgi:hypothetical protein